MYAIFFDIKIFFYIKTYEEKNILKTINQLPGD